MFLFLVFLQVRGIETNVRASAAAFNSILFIIIVVIQSIITANNASVGSIDISHKVSCAVTALIVSIMLFISRLDAGL